MVAKKPHLAVQQAGRAVSPLTARVPLCKQAARRGLRALPHQKHGKPVVGRAVSPLTAGVCLCQPDGTQGTARPKIICHVHNPNNLLALCGSQTIKLRDSVLRCPRRRAQRQATEK